MTRNPIVGVAALVAALMLPASASAQDNRAEAQKAFRAGQQAYQAGQYGVAARAFERAYKALPVPAIAFSTAQAHRKQYFVDKEPGRIKRALELYREYIAKVPKGGRRDDAVSNIAELEPQMARLKATMRKPIEMPKFTQATELMVSARGVKGAKASIDGKAGDAPLMLRVKPGAHKVRVTAEGYFPVEQTATAVKGKFITVEVTLRPKPALVRVRAPGGTTVTVDGRPVGTTPMSRPLAVSAGKHFIAFTKRGYRSWSREIVVKRGDEIEIAASMRRTTQRKIAYYVLGAATVMWLATGASALGAKQAGDDAKTLDTKRNSEGLTVGELNEYLDLKQTHEDRITQTYGLLGVAAAISVAGGLLYLFDNSRAEVPPSALTPGAPQPERKPFTVAPMVDRHVTGLALSGRF